MRQSSLLVIFLIAFIDLVGFGIILPVMPFYAHQYGATAFNLGWLMTAYTLVQFVVSPLWGKISDYLGRRLVILLTLAGTCVSLALLGVSGSLEWVFIARILAGASGAVLSTAYAYVTDVASNEDRPKALGMLQAGFALGMIFGPAIGGLLSRYSLTLPIFAAAVMALFNLLFAFIKLDEPRLATATRSANRYKRFDMSVVRLALEDPRTRLAALLLFLCTFAISQMETVFALYLLFRHHYDAENTGVLHAVIGLVIVGVQAGLIRGVTQKFGLIRVVFFGTAIFAAGMAGLVTAPWAAAFFASIVVLAFGQGMLNPVLTSLALSGATANRRAAAMGVFRSFGSMARIISPPIAGWLFDRMSWRSPFLLASGILLIAAVISFLWTVLPSRISTLAEAESNPYFEG